MTLRIAMLITLVCAGSSANSAEISEQEKLLRSSMAQGSDTAIPIRAYAATGHVRLKPDVGADYNDYRRLRKPAVLFGHKLLAIEEEYMSQYIGCCVSPGIGMVIEVIGSTTELEAAVAENKCRIDPLGGPEGTMTDLGITRETGKTYLSISCRERDYLADK